MGLEELESLKSAKERLQTRAREKAEKLLGGPLISSTDAAEIVGLSRPFFRSLIRSGTFGAVKVDGFHFLKVEEIERLLEDRRKKADRMARLKTAQDQVVRGAETAQKLRIDQKSKAAQEDIQFQEIRELMLEGFLTPNKMAPEVGVSPQHLRRLIRRGVIKAVRVGNRFYIHEREKTTFKDLDLAKVAHRMRKSRTR